MNKLLFFIALSLCMHACIKDDFVEDKADPVLRITSAFDTIAINTSVQLEKMYLNDIGQEEEIDVTWSSSNDTVLSVDQMGMVSALSAGSATITVATVDVEPALSDELSLVVGEETTIAVQSFSGTIVTTSTYALQGDFEYTGTADGVNLNIQENYVATSALPGLYIYLSNNPNSVANALEIGAVETFEGAHSYDIPNVGFNDYTYIVYFCKPFNVKVGEARLF